MKRRTDLKGRAAGMMAERAGDERFTPIRGAELSSYEPSWRDRFRAILLGDMPASERSAGRQRLADNLTGLLDFTGIFAPNESYRAAKAGDYGSAALEAASVAPIPAVKGPAKAAKAAKGAKKVAKKITKSAQLPSLRGLPIPEAVKIARKEPHLIKTGEASAKGYVGGPRKVTSKQALNKIRKEFDAYVAADPRGADWYDRYRAGVREVTGGNPKQMDWMTATHGQFSAGVDPWSELLFSTKENNGWLTGYPVKAARPAQHKAMKEAIDANDWRKMQLGDKTGEYAYLTNPNNVSEIEGATGVNDFRHGENFGHLEADGSRRRSSFTSAEHAFLDYETALAVDRANKANLGGRSDWTGEKLQAAPWVRQKATDLSARRKKPYEEIFQNEANKTITEHFPKATLSATYEAQPGAMTGHLPGSVNATKAEREAFAADPRSSWANAPGGRDAIYSGLQLGDTGIAARVRPTVGMTGVYTPPGGLLETNPGEIARPLVGQKSQQAREGRQRSFGRVLPRGDRAMAQTAETVRAGIDAQGAGAAHIVRLGPQNKHADSYVVSLDRQPTAEEVVTLQGLLGPLNLGDVSARDGGLTLTNFYKPNRTQGDALADPKDVLAAVKQVFPDATDATKAQVGPGNSVYAGLEDAWEAGEGSGEVTRRILKEVNQTPEMRAAFEANEMIPENAMARLERDDEWAARWGATRADIQNLRRVIGQGGKKWVTALEKALKEGKISLPAAAALLGTSMHLVGGDRPETDERS